MLDMALEQQTDLRNNIETAKRKNDEGAEQEAVRSRNPLQETL
jgi:hypothetical protein